MDSNYLIAEIAGSHNGEQKNIMKIIEQISNNTDGIKFQPYHYSTISLGDHKFYNDYIKLTDKINEHDWKKIIIYAFNKKIDVWIDIQDEFSLKIVNQNLEYITGIKIPSGNLYNIGIMEKICNYYKKKIILNFGGYQDSDIDFILNNYVWNTDNIILQTGIQNFPTDIEDSNLIKINYLKNKYNISVSYADHIDGYSEISALLPIYAFFAGAFILEKHICLSREDKYDDFESSLNINEFKNLYKNLKQLSVVYENKNHINSNEKYKNTFKMIPVLKDNKVSNNIITSNDIIYKKSKHTISVNEFNELLPARCNIAIDKNIPLNKNMIEKINIVAVIVCRFKSTRLPGKSLLKLNNIESLQRCIINVKNISNVNKVILAISENKSDDVLIEFAQKEGIEYVRGSEKIVLDRYIKAADKTNSDIIVRITGDQPCISYEIANILINSHINSKKDYSVLLPNTYLVGSECEVINVSSLKLLKNKLCKEGLNLTEYLTFFYISNPNFFAINVVKLPEIFYKNITYVPFSLDTEYDYSLLKDIYEFSNIGNKPIPFTCVRNFFLKNGEKYVKNKNLGLGSNIDDTLKLLNKYCKLNDNFYPCYDIEQRIIELYENKNSKFI